MKMKIQIAFHATIALAALAVGLAGCKKENAAPENVKQPPLVSVIAARNADSAQKVALSGQIKARHETALGFRVAGKIATRAVDAGQTVKAGDLLYTLDDTDYELKVNAMQAAETAAKSKLDNANDELGRHQRMLDKALISQAQYDRVKSGCEQAKAGYEAACAARKNAENDAGYTKLVADGTAIVSEVLADSGQVIAAGMPVLMLSQTNEVEAEIYIPEKYASLVKIGDAASIHVSSVGTGAYEGYLREVAGNADPRTRTYRARVAFKETPQNLRLGMSADATISVPLSKPGALIPPESVCDGDKPHVWIVGADTVAQKRNIEILGVQNGRFIASGVGEGESIVVEGARFLSTPEKVRTSQNSAE
jgi:membrane fusion protein, multidrug efflux system